MSKGQNSRKGLSQTRGKWPVLSEDPCAGPSGGGHELCVGNLLTGTPRPSPDTGDLFAGDLAAPPPDCLLQDQTDGS